MTAQPSARPPARPSDGSAAPGYLAVLAVPEFRTVFAAHTLSLLGVVVSELALTVLVYDLTGSPLLSALTFALGFLPYLLGGTLLSGVADRYPARRVLVVGDLLCAACAALMVLPLTPVAGLLALRCAVAAVSPVFTGTRMATLTDILGDGELFVLGRSLLRIVSQSALLAGFGAGGLLLTLLPPRGAICVTVATFLGSAALLRFGTRARPARATADGRGSLLGDSLSGARQVFADRRLRALMLMFWVPPFFIVVPEGLATPYADGIGASTAALGLLMCAMPVGTVAGELFAGSALGEAARERIVVPLAALCTVPFALYALRPSMPVAALALVLTGLAHAYTLGLDRWFVAAVPEELKGRAMTLLTAGMMTVQGLGMALAGAAAELWPVHRVVVGAGALGTAATLVLLVELRATREQRDGASGGTEGRDGADRHVTSG